MRRKSTFAIACVCSLLITRGEAAADASTTVPSAEPYTAVKSGVELHFPADYGSHPDFRTEWWYITGWLQTADNKPLGFQITFFRTRPRTAEANPSKFAARQLLIAHSAISDPQRGRLWQDQRIRRMGLGLAAAAVGDTRVSIGDWSLGRHDDDGYHAVIHAAEFSLDLDFAKTQPVLLNGAQGVSRKGPEPSSASYYYSLPQLRTSGRVIRDGHVTQVTGVAWFDHEWSSEYLDAKAVGWDWVGLNLDDGGALMAFRIRDAAGNARWAGGTFREGDGVQQVLDAQAVTMTPQRHWRSPRTGTSYPVQWNLKAGDRVFTLTPLMDDQENDTRLSTGAIYWEGAVHVSEHERSVGRGYLELTGYGEKLNLR